MSLERDEIEPCTSGYPSRLVVAKRKPLVNDVLNQLQGARIFNVIDLKNGFHHVPVEKESRKYTAFVTQNGQYQFKKISFGLSICPAVFQRFLRVIFRDLIREGTIFMFVDDLVIPVVDQ